MHEFQTTPVFMMAGYATLLLPCRQEYGGSSWGYVPGGVANKRLAVMRRVAYPAVMNTAPDEFLIYVLKKQQPIFAWKSKMTVVLFCVAEVPCCVL